MFTHISVDLQLQFYRLATWCVITDAGRAAVSTIPVRAVFHSLGNVWPISRWLFFFCSVGSRTLGARFDAGLWRGSEVGPLWWLYDPTPSTRPNFIKGRIPRTKRTRSTESPIPGRIVTWEAPRSPADARTSHGARRTRRRAHRRDRKKQQQLYISKSRRNSSVEPGAQPPRHGDHRRRSGRQSHDEPEGGAAGFRAREYFLHCRSARPSGLGEPCWTSAPAVSSPAAGVVVVALFARVASTPPDVEDDDDEPLRSQASLVTPVGDDDEVSAAIGCTTRECCSPLGSSSSSVTRGALLAAFFALRENIYVR